MKERLRVYITETQRRLIMRALTMMIANDRRGTEGGVLTREPDELMDLVRLFATAKHDIGGLAARAAVPNEARMEAMGFRKTSRRR